MPSDNLSNIRIVWILCSIRKWIIRILFQERVNTFNWKKKNINNNMVNMLVGEKQNIRSYIHNRHPKVWLMVLDRVFRGLWLISICLSWYPPPPGQASLPRQASNMHILDRPPRTDRTTTISPTSPTSYFTVQGHLCVSIVLLCWSTQQYPSVQVWI